uniref:Uncharacterized protein n=1 Tax=Meloidogyne enterolobii TaxID=390850 RepID=A0A6V7W7P3_MELEN|nr:unnamed protein product [Meloidogyne enterolobii]
MKGVSAGKRKRRSKPKTKPTKFKKQQKREQNKEIKTEKKQNPFDLAFNKKHGGNSKKQSNGFLGKSKILDRRIGQRNSQLSEENKGEKRFIFQQKKLAEKKNAEIGAKNIDSQKQSGVEGFGLERVHWRNMGNSDESSNEGSDDESFGNKSKRAKKESLAELVAHDRQMRALKTMLKDEQEEKTERLDICFKEIKQFGGLNQISRQSNKIREDEEELEDNYDFLYHQLQFQPTIVAQPNNVLIENKLNKTVDQQKKEKKNLENPEQLEKEEKAKKAVQSKIAKEREKKWAKRVKDERRNTIKYLRKEAKNSAKLFIEKRRQIRKERDEKTKKILQSLEVQESEYKKLQAIGGKL